MIRLESMKKIVWQKGEVTELEIQNLMKPRLSIGLYNLYKPYLKKMYKSSVEFDKANGIWRFVYQSEKLLPEGQVTLDLQN